jgi:hypothetical protein
MSGQKYMKTGWKNYRLIEFVNNEKIYHVCETEEEEYFFA